MKIIKIKNPKFKITIMISSNVLYNFDTHQAVRPHIFGITITFQDKRKYLKMLSAKRKIITRIF